MHLKDILENLEIDPKEEIDKLYNIIYRDSFNFMELSMSFRNFININFVKLPIRGTFNTFDEMLEKLKIVKSNQNKDIIFERLILFSEIILSIIHQMNNTDIFDDYSDSGYDCDICNTINILKSNIIHIFIKLNYDIYYKENYAYISPKNSNVEQVINIIDSCDIAIEILHYNNNKLQGNLKEKRKILTLLASFIEPVLNSKILTNNGFKNLESNTGLYLNKFNIRHNNTDGKNKVKFADKLNDNDLEIWYDKAYNTILSVIIIEKEIKNSKELKEFMKENNL